MSSPSWFCWLTTHLTSFPQSSLLGINEYSFSTSHTPSTSFSIVSTSNCSTSSRKPVTSGIGLPPLDLHLKETSWFSTNIHFSPASTISPPNSMLPGVATCTLTTPVSLSTSPLAKARRRQL